MTCDACTFTSMGAHWLQASACVVVCAKDTRGAIKTYAHRLVNGHGGSSLAPLLVQPESLQVPSANAVRASQNHGIIHLVGMHG